MLRLLTPATTNPRGARTRGPLDYFASKAEAREDYELFLSDRAEWERQGEAERNERLALSVDESRER
jgi:hypothetical protein